MSPICWAGGALGALWALNGPVAQLVTAGLGAGILRHGKHPSAVALTFDDGPHSDHTNRICDILEAHGARGTFFVLAGNVRRLPHITGALIERGHQVELHGLRHRHPWFSLPGATLRALTSALRIVEDTTGVRPRYLRPPWGMCSLDGLVSARKLKLRVVRWSVCPEGFFRPASAPAMAAHVLERVRGGDIVCLHDAGGFPDTPERVTACLRDLLPRLSGSGLAAATLSEVLVGP